ncbi:MAG: GNAT family N-acetyltransferase, partial [Bacteroidota bacterium]
MSSQTVTPQTHVGTIVRVDSPELEKAFYGLPEKIYAHDPDWIRPLIQDVKKVFDPKQNPFFEHGELDRWVLKSPTGEVIGRVAAFINERKAHTFRQPTGGMGFFECVEDQDAAFALFDTAKAWLEAHNMEAMDGPINFGERSQFWGLMIENDMDTPYQHCYNP